MDLEQVRDAYTSVAEVYIERFGTRRQVHADDLAFIGRHLSGRPGSVLDLGCGPGHLTDYLSSLGADAVGIDMVPEFIAHARAAHPQGRYRLGSLLSLEAGNRSVAARLARAGFAEVARLHRPSDGTHRTYGALAAVVGEP